MLIATSGLYELSSEVQALVQSEASWAELEATPVDKLTPTQLRVLGEMGVNLDGDEEDDDGDADEEDGDE